jgi:hypothetical protein
MQIEPREIRPEGDRSAQQAQREILAILAECGFVPGQGVEAMLDRLSGERSMR